MCVYTFCDREKSLVLRLDTGFDFFFTDILEPACYSFRNREDVHHLLLQDIEGSSGFFRSCITSDHAMILSPRFSTATNNESHGS
jgi:hypothetical protein